MLFPLSQNWAGKQSVFKLKKKKKVRTQEHPFANGKAQILTYMF